MLAANCGINAVCARSIRFLINCLQGGQDFCTGLGVQNFGQGLKITVGLLCTLKEWDRKHEPARKIRNLSVGKSFGQGQK